MTSLIASTVCFRQYDLPRALATADRLGFGAVDLVGLRGLCEHVPVNGDRSARRAAAAVFLDSGLRASSVNADPGSFDGVDDPAEVMQRVHGLLEFCDEVGAPLLVLPCGEKTADRGAEPAYRRMADALGEAGEAARRRGIRLAVEAPYFGRPVDTLDRTDALAELLPPDIQLALDVSHVIAAGDTVADAWARFASRVAIVHLRDAVRGDIRRVIGRGEVDFDEAFRLAAEVGYRGDWVLELETRNSPFATKEAEVADAVTRLAALQPAHS